MPVSLSGAGRLALIGCGHMGGALLAGFLARGLAIGRVSVVEPSPSPALLAWADQGLALNGPPRPVDTLLMAVKPQVMDAALAGTGAWLGPETLVISIAAGKRIAGFEAALGAHRAIVRTMPNTPAAVGRGMTVGVANAATTPEQRARVETLMTAVGRFAWLDDEDLIDAVTAVAGSGPAYVFHLVEALAAAGVACGLPPALAETLARATVEGAGELLAQRAEEAPGSLRAAVTSPGGTTAAALHHLMASEQGLAALLERAVLAARDRGRALSA